jgi:predicted  nucleic acid-binding Zn-ribbon protein
MHWLYLVSSVRCLACGTVYPKPDAGGTAASNPGCPHCGYVGWLPVEDDEEQDEDEVMGELAQRPSGADRPRLRFWRAS